MTMPFGDARTLELRDGKVATLVRVPASGEKRGAILYLHGFSDYFFQRHVGEHFAARGWDFYGLDLRGYGRSIREGDLPNYIEDLATYFEDLDAAVAAIRKDGHAKLVVLGHSTGGLIAPLWAHARRDDHLLDAMVLNSPWFELADGWFNRTIGSAVVSALAAIAPKLVVRNGLGPVYGESVHRDHHGEWDFDVAWKPIHAFPIRAGWLRAIRRGHARLQRGLDVGVPVLVLRSSRSLLHATVWTPETMRADTVLDVADMTRYAPCVGKEVEVVTIDDGMHDLFLSAKDVRERALSAIDEWLDERR
jgi:alpha-beta hydrolase superfamily lysophospholipase